MASNYYTWHHGRVHYQKRGLGDPLVLVHNVYPGASHEEYAHNIAELARHFTVYAMDLLGFGGSDAPRMKYTANTYTELVFDFLREEVGRPVLGSEKAKSFVDGKSIKKIIVVPKKLVNIVVG